MKFKFLYKFIALILLAIIIILLQAYAFAHDYFDILNEVLLIYIWWYFILYSLGILSYTL